MGEGVMECIKSKVGRSPRKRTRRKGAKERRTANRIHFECRIGTVIGSAWVESALVHVAWWSVRTIAVWTCLATLLCSDDIWTNDLHQTVTTSWRVRVELLHKAALSPTLSYWVGHSTNWICLSTGGSWLAPETYTVSKDQTQQKTHVFITCITV